ncbi:ATP-binding protein [Methylobrevis albus]|uniref:histidine kinase n=1 Tax=Methylobrevis albus TaxID=2793297 RepID=A0A931I2D6_9HYPH|nr:ATP-binding protein [Methylobrevis albus]MBH0238557.1 HAMP domain-containing protein [Methylobrevis albus]
MTRLLARLPRLRLFPRSMAWQLVALLIAVALAAQALTLVLLVDERRNAIQIANREQVLSRTASLVRLIEETPASVHQRILDTASGGRLTFTVDPEASVTRAPQSRGEIAVTGALSEMLDDAPDIRAAIDIDRPPRPRDRAREAERKAAEGGPETAEERIRREQRAAERLERWRAREAERERDGRPRHGAAGVTAAISVPLADGRFLNVFAQFGPPPPLLGPAFYSTLAITLAMVLVVALSVRRITRPLRALGEAADRFGRGESVAQLPETGPIEVKQATAAFNAMQERIGRFVTDRTRLLGAISHDLRTPLTALRLRAEFVDDDEIRAKLIETIDEMSRMTEATLAFAREDASHEPARAVDLAALVAAVADDFADMGEAVSADVPARLDLVVRPTALRRALRNLIENALRYGGAARVTLKEGTDDLSIRIDDDGPGIPPDRMDDVFEPFLRLETSRSQDTGGVGLGLATARSIVHAHGGEIRLANRPEGGLSATIHLPRPG